MARQTVLTAGRVTATNAKRGWPPVDADRSQTVPRPAAESSQVVVRIAASDRWLDRWRACSGFV
jgi:hypothetical protein